VAVQWAAVRSKYFAVAVIPEQATTKSRRAFVPADGIVPPVGTPPAIAGMVASQVATALVLPVPPDGMAHHLRIYAGPNDYWMLEKVGYRLQDIVDLGWPIILPFSQAILVVLVFFHRFIANYGVVILLLSLLVKVLFHPLTASSLRSMRAMQRIQPEVEKLRKRHEKDPQKMNQAVFALYKENKISPLGGCLPMLIQMPVMFALYQVFLHAIELRQSPFLLWIDDLSAPDVLFQVAGFPIRILPVIMFGSSLLQQKMTPTDPRQVTTMYIMNVVMLVLFYNLPSGLVLYWTVTNLLTALQQYLVTHGEQTTPIPATT
jgi:YidC/Oxa1 family membrane protein insertase